MVPVLTIDAVYPEMEPRLIKELIVPALAIPFQETLSIVPLFVNELMVLLLIFQIAEAPDEGLTIIPSFVKFPMVLL